MKKGILIVIMSSLFLFLLINLVYASTQSDFLSLINKERASLNKSALYINDNLTESAFLHSQEMGQKNYFSHDSFDGTSFDKRISAAGYSGFEGLAENIAYASGPADASSVFTMWMNSPGHYENMIGNYDEMGLGVFSINGLTYYTLDLGKRFNFVPPKVVLPVTPVQNVTVKPPVAPVQNVSSSVPVKNMIFISLQKIEIKNFYSRLIEFVGSLNENAKVSYSLNGKSYLICSNCNKFNMYFVTSSGNIKLNVTATDSKGKSETRVFY